VHRPLRIFLGERLTVMRAGRDLALRMRRSGAYPAPVEARLDDAADELGLGCDTVASFMRQGGAGRPWVRVLAGAAAERVGRLKMNGRIRGRSPLTDLEELDALVATLHYAAAAWRALEHAPAVASDVVRPRAEACEALMAAIEPARLDAAERALVL
jgi:hypothetical protein